MPDGLVPEPGNDNPLQGDLLEQLLVVAAEKAARNEADQALKKGFVTREQINMALDAMGQRLETTIVEKISNAIEAQVKTSVVNTLETQPGLRKSTVLTAEDELEADPVKFILKKSLEQGAESLTQTEKDIVWGLTKTALSEGMSYDAREEE